MSSAMRAASSRTHEIGGNRDRLDVRSRHARQRRVEVLRAARHERDFRAFARERFGAGKADALARAGDDDDRSRQFKIHGSPLS